MKVRPAAVISEELVVLSESSFTIESWLGRILPPDPGGGGGGGGGGEGEGRRVWRLLGEEDEEESFSGFNRVLVLVADVVGGCWRILSLPPPGGGWKPSWGVTTLGRRETCAGGRGEGGGGR